MRQGRIRDEGRDVLRITVEAVRFVCANGHEWELSRAAILQAGEGAELCPVCRRVAIDAIPTLTANTERRSVVIDALFGDADA